MNTPEVLRAAREYISDPARWTQHRYGTDGGERCMIGACASAIGSPDIYSVEQGPAVGALARAIGIDVFNVSDFNDSHTHAEVLALFDRAIAIEEAKAAEFTAASEPAPLVAA